MREAPNSAASGFISSRVCVAFATTVARDVRTAIGPISDASVAVGPSVVLRHEQEERDEERGSDLVWCIGHSCPSAWSHVHACSTAPVRPVMHKVTGTSTIADVWQRSQAPTTHATCRRNATITG